MFCSTMSCSPRLAITAYLIAEKMPSGVSLIRVLAKEKHRRLSNVCPLNDHVFTGLRFHIWALFPSPLKITGAFSWLDWVLSHWAHFTVRRFICRFIFICVYFVCSCFILHSCCIIVSMVEWT